MIDNYEIKRINGEDVLYLYFNFDYEFSKFNLKENYKNLEQYIKKFINNNKIFFTGTLVTLIASGIIIGNVNLNNDSKIYINNTIFDNVISERVDIEEQNNINKEVNDVVLNNKVSKVDRISLNDEVEGNNIVSSKDEVSDINNQVEVQNEIVKSNENLTYVTLRRSNGEVAYIELEEYLIGVVGAEMPASFNIEALKSQSVISRTYALKSISSGRVLTDNESTQSYKSNDELRNMWGSSYDVYYSKIKNAINSTKGEYLTYNGNYIEAVFHSTSNGTTEDARNVWGNYYPYLVSVDSLYDSFNPSYEKEKSFSYDELSSKLGFYVNSETEFNILSYTSGNRVENISIDNNVFTGVSLRSILGLRSTDFEIIKNDAGVTFKTKGYGHGVGMSQYGANGMAKSGYSYRDILNHYYPGVSISSL